MCLQRTDSLKITAMLIGIALFSFGSLSYASRGQEQRRSHRGHFSRRAVGRRARNILSDAIGLLDMGIMTAAITSLREPSVVGWFTPFLFDSVAEAEQARCKPILG